MTLLDVNRIFGPEPTAPTAFEGMDIGESFASHFLCHTGTGVLAGSSAVGHIAFVLGVLSDPLIEVVWIGPKGAFDFEFR